MERLESCVSVAAIYINMDLGEKKQEMFDIRRTKPDVLKYPLFKM
jgi:hypothetical protein